MLKHGLGRDTGEPVKNWLQRLEREGVDSAALRTLEGVVALHYRYRFDPNSSADDERAKLAHSVSQWLNDYDEIKAHKSNYF